MNAPDLIEPLVGFRGFNVDDDGWLASPTMRSGIWKPGMNKATCQASTSAGAIYYIGSPYGPPEPKAPPGHAVPHEHCSCGLYAMHSIADLGGYATGTIVTAIAAEGQVCLSGTGFRAERAEIVLVAATSDDFPEQELERIARAYRCKAVPLAEIEKEAAAFGAIAPASLTPGKEAKPSGVFAKGSTDLVTAPVAMQVASGGTLSTYGFSDVETPSPPKRSFAERHAQKLIWTAVAFNCGAAAFHLVLGVGV